MIVTKSCDPVVVDLIEWRRKYEAALEAEAGRPRQPAPTPRPVAHMRRAAVASAVRHYARAAGIDPTQYVHHAMAAMDLGASAAEAIRLAREAMRGR